MPFAAARWSCASRIAPCRALCLSKPTKKEARVADVGSWGKIYAEYIPSLGEAIYMAWVVGEPTEADLAHIFVSILNNFRSGSSEELIH